MTADIAPPAVNDPPDVPLASLSGLEDTPLIVTLNAVDPELDPLTWGLSVPPSHGFASLDPSSGELTYIPDPNFHGGPTRPPPPASSRT